MKGAEIKLLFDFKSVGQSILVKCTCTLCHILYCFKHSNDIWGTAYLDGSVESLLDSKFKLFNCIRFPILQKSEVNTNSIMPRSIIGCH